MTMKHSWLRESVDKVLAEAPHMSDAHKKKLVETVGLELARAHARGSRKEQRIVFDGDHDFLPYKERSLPRVALSSLADAVQMPFRSEIRTALESIAHKHDSLKCTECKGEGYFRDAPPIATNDFPSREERAEALYQEFKSSRQCEKCRGTGHAHACSSCGIIDLNNDGSCAMCSADIPIRPEG